MGSFGRVHLYLKYQVRGLDVEGLRQTFPEVHLADGDAQHRERDEL